ncbi:MAG: protein phosphatase CheZ [Betaproteobacteria bacterium]|nr:protein phosphatase CheZ [Betaproteobacteria bacterium]
MKNIENFRHDVETMVDELRSALSELDSDGPNEASVVSNARDRLRYISALTEQAAGRTLTAAEALSERIKAQRATAAALIGKTRSAEIRAFLEQMQAEDEVASAQLTEIIQAQEFQDLVGQVVNKLMVMVQKMEDKLVHLLIDEDPDPHLAGPATRAEDRVSQDDIDDLFE